MAGAGSWPRCALFNLAFFAWTALITLTLWPTILVSRGAMRWSARLWARGVMALLARLVGLRHQVRGSGHLPAGPVVLAAKHQSAWDTVIFYLLFDGPVYVLKKELLAIPIAGWYLRRVGMVAVDRRGGASALKAMIAGVEAALADGRAVVIFPEGTRTAPGERRPYHPGVAALYTRLAAPVVPVALNSGLFWPRRRILEEAGPNRARIPSAHAAGPRPPGLHGRARAPHRGCLRPPRRGWPGRGEAGRGPWARRLERFQFDWNRSRPQGGPPVARRARAGADLLVRCRERNSALEWVRSKRSRSRRPALLLARPGRPAPPQAASLIDSPRVSTIWSICWRETTSGGDIARMSPV